MISTNSSLQEELKKSQVSLLSFEEFRKGSEMATTKLKSQLKEREDLIQEQSATINGLTNQQKAEKASFELQMEEANKKMQNLQAEHERVAKDHDHQVTELRASITDAEDKLSKLRTQFEATSQILFQQNAQIDELQHRLDSVQVAAKNSEIQYQTLSQEHDTIQKTLAEALQNLQSHKEQLSSQQTMHEETINQLTQSHNSILQQRELEKQEQVTEFQALTQKHETTQQALTTALQDLHLAQGELSLKV